MTEQSDGGAADGAADGNDGKGAGSGDDGGKSPHQPMDLESVHARVMAEKGEEFSKPEGAAADDDGDGSGDGDDDEKATKGSEDDTKNDGGSDDDNDDDTEEDDTPPDPAEHDQKKPAAAEIEAPEIDGDTSKPGKYKAEFVDEDGNKYYVSNVKELPDDFEPQSQRQYGVALQDLFEKQSQFRQDQKAYDEQKATADTEAAVKNLRDSWNQDIEKLGKAGIKLDDGRTLKLPADPKERDKAINGTYKLMDAEFKKGNTIEHFAVAYELYEARQARKAQEQAAADAQRTANEEKGKKGGKVMGGSAGAGVNTRPLIRKGVPPGIGLERVHQNAVNKLNS